MTFAEVSRMLGSGGPYPAGFIASGTDWPDECCSQTFLLDYFDGPGEIQYGNEQGVTPFEHLTAFDALLNSGLLDHWAAQ
jgi:hypothetical protein